MAQLDTVLTAMDTLIAQTGQTLSDAVIGTTPGDVGRLKDQLDSYQGIRAALQGWQPDDPGVNRGDTA